jgi:hypothetical protein
MKHRKYEELLQLYVYGELDDEALKDFEEHFHQCSVCRKELEELKKLSAVLEQYKPVLADEKILQEARNELSRSLIPTDTTPSFWNRLLEFIYNAFPSYKVALGGAALIIVGFLAGHLFTPSTKYQVPSTVILTGNTTNFGEPLSSSPRISNIRFIDSDDADGEIEFTFDAVMPVHLKGRVDDPNVQKVLATALISENNPGIRLQSASAVTSDDRISKLDDELMDALISAVRYDKNPGVRREALQALQSYESDPRARQALLDVLAHDESAGLRISAINILTNWNSEYFRGDSSLVKILKININSESNNYIRMRSHAFIKEIQP